MTASTRQWAPDPTGRHPYRSHLNGEWTDLVARDAIGSGVATDTAGGRLARGATAQASVQRPKRDPLATAIAAFSVIPFGAAALFVLTVIVAAIRGVGMDAGMLVVLVVWGLGCTFVGLLVLALARGVRNSARRSA